jgi:hypothetical protein
MSNVSTGAAVKLQSTILVADIPLQIAAWELNGPQATKSTSRPTPLLLVCEMLIDKVPGVLIFKK